MLKFRSKKKVYFPKFSILIWLITLVLVLYYLYYKDGVDINHMLALKPLYFMRALEDSKWNALQLLTTVFLHGSMKHWLGNMIVFLIIAFPLEKRIGGFWFLMIYFCSAFSANVFAVIQLNDSSHYILGASGAVSGLLGAWLVLFPQQKINIVIPIGLYLQRAKVPLYLLGLIWLVIQIALQVYSPKDFPIVWGSHIVGFINGFLIAWLYRTTVK